jgi:hypothetical protein
MRQIDYTSPIYRAVARHMPRAGVREVLDETVSVERDSRNAKTVLFYDAEGVNYARIYCPCAGIKPMTFNDARFDTDEAKESERKRIHDLVVAKFK